MDEKFMVLPPDTLTEELRRYLWRRGCKLRENSNGVELIWLPLILIERIDCGFSDGVNTVVMTDGFSFEI